VDININYLEESNRVKQLNALIKTYNLINTITFPTRIGRSISTATDNIFLDISKYDNHSISFLSNGLLDHEAQLLTIVLTLNYDSKYHIFSYRKINNFTIAHFQLQLSQENWESVFGENNVNLIFNSFLNTYLRIFNSSFPIIKRQHKTSKSSNITWITHEIRISCKHTRELYSIIKNNESTVKY
jgi:hypothetical protein